MSEAAEHGYATADSTAAGQGGVTAGILLRQAREAAGVHILALAAALKVPPGKLEALEADDLSALPDAVFVRGLASSACRALRVDPAPVLALLPQSRGPQLAARDAGINARFKAPREAPRAAAAEQASRPVVYGVVALLLGALVLVFLPRIKSEVASLAGGAAPAPAPEAAAPQPEAPAAAAIVENLTRADVAAAAAAPAALPLPDPANASAPIGITAPLQAVPAQPANAPVLGPVAAPAESVAAQLLVFTARGDSWVKVTDAKGGVAFQRMLAAGESASVSAAPPLNVVVGRSDLTTVQLRGKPFDLTPLARDNVARFEVR